LMQSDLIRILKYQQQKCELWNKSFNNSDDYVTENEYKAEVSIWK
jgi:hypothetical protein